MGLVTPGTSAALARAFTIHSDLYFYSLIFPLSKARSIPKKKSHPIYMTNSLAKASSRETSDPRDRVYSVIGLFPRSLELMPRYKASIPKIWEDGTIALMKYWNSLHLLVLVDSNPKRYSDLSS